MVQYSTPTTTVMLVSLLIKRMELKGITQGRKVMSCRVGGKALESRGAFSFVFSMHSRSCACVSSFCIAFFSSSAAEETMRRAFCS